MVDRTPLRYLLDENGNPAGLTEFRAGDQLPASILANALSLVLGEIEASGNSAIAPGDSIAQAFAKLQAQVGAAQAALDGKQSALISGENIKTFGGQSLLGSGDIRAGGYEIGDIAITCRTLSPPEWLPAYEEVYLQSAYPELYGVVGLLPFADGRVDWVTPPPIASSPYFSEKRSLAFFANGEFVATTGATLLTSLNGSEWLELGWDLGEITALVHAGGYFAAAGPYIQISTDPNVWDDSPEASIRPFPDPSFARGRHIEHIVFGDGTIIIATTAGDMAVSTDWVNWTPTRMYGYQESSEIRSFSYLNGLFYLLEDWDIFVSPDGVTWDNPDNWHEGEPTSLIYENGLYVGVFQDWGIATRREGEYWELRLRHGEYDPEYYENMGDVLYADGLFISSNSSGRVATSLNGINWFVRDEPQIVDFEHKLVCGNGTILAHGIAGGIRLGSRKGYGTDTQFITPNISVPGVNTYLKAK